MGLTLRCMCCPGDQQCDHEIPITDELAEAVGEYFYNAQNDPNASEIHRRCREYAVSAREVREAAAEAAGHAAAAEEQVRDDDGSEWETDPQWALPVISDEEAAVKLRLLHQRMGHASLRFLRKLHSSGELLGFDISPDQFDCIQFWCDTCAKTRGTKKPHAHRRRGGTSSKRILERVFVDVAGPRKVPSMYHTGPRGNIAGGGNYYTVFYLDAATERGFVSFVTHKCLIDALPTA